MRAISIDPGETVGWAVWHEEGQLFDQGEYEWEDFLVHLEKMLEKDAIDHIIMEDYRLRKSASKAMINNQFLTVQVIGVIKWFSRKYDIPLTLQLPAQAKQFWDNDKLKMIDVYERGQRHSRDAVRHGLYFFYNGGGKDLIDNSLKDLLGGLT